MIIGLILGLAILVRVININQGLWLDEATHAILSSKSISEIVFNRGADFHPPLSYLVYHFWIQFSHSEFWLRGLSVIFGVLTIYISYILSKELFNKKIALLAAFLLAISPYHIYYSQEVRMYSLATLLAVLSMFFLLKKVWWGYVLSTALLLYTLYTGVFLVLAQLLYALILDKQKLRQFLYSQIGILILYLPWLPQFIKQLQGGVNIDEYLPGWRQVLGVDLVKSVPLTIFKFTAGRIDFDNNYLYSGLILLTLIIVGVCIYHVVKHKLSKETKLIVFWFLVPLLLSIIISIQIPLNQPFRLLFILPAFYIFLALGVLSSGKIKNILLGFLIAFSSLGSYLYYTESRFQREDWKSVAEILRTKVSNDSAGVISVWPEPFPPYQWYAKNAYAIAMGPKMPYKYTDVDQRLDSVKYRDIYLFEYLQDLSDPNRYTQKWLEDNQYTVTEILDYRGVGFIYHYVKK